jgi:pimeloyl-ACP methyl ester carboxylesterase
VLLLHGGGADSRRWDGHLERFAQAYQTVRIDLPGAGASPFPDKPYVPNDLLERLLAALGIGRTALVGVPAGGGLAIDFAIERPQRTWALVVVASGPRGIDDIPPDPRMQAFSQAIVAGDRDRAAELLLQAWVPLRTSPELDGRIRRMVHDSIGMLKARPKGCSRRRRGRRLGEIGVPALAIWGDRDGEGRPLGWRSPAAGDVEQAQLAHPLGEGAPLGVGGIGGQPVLVVGGLDGRRLSRVASRLPSTPPTANPVSSP